eukprot:6207803-Pleurochrysis_carterae.AAC.2
MPRDGSELLFCTVSMALRRLKRPNQRPSAFARSHALGPRVQDQRTPAPHARLNARVRARAYAHVRGCTGGSAVSPGRHQTTRCVCARARAPRTAPHRLRNRALRRRVCARRVKPRRERGAARLWRRAATHASAFARAAARRGAGWAVRPTDGGGTPAVARQRRRDEGLEGRAGTRLGLAEAVELSAAAAAAALLAPSCRFPCATAVVRTSLLAWRVSGVAAAAIAVGVEVPDGDSPSHTAVEAADATGRLAGVVGCSAQSVVCSTRSAASRSDPSDERCPHQPLPSAGNCSALPPLCFSPSRRRKHSADCIHRQNAQCCRPAHSPDVLVPLARLRARPRRQAGSERLAAPRGVAPPVSRARAAAAAAAAA